MAAIAKNFAKRIAIILATCPCVYLPTPVFAQAQASLTSAGVAGIKYEEESMDEPYSYFVRPATAIGFKDNLEAISIWPDTWGQMLFFTGDKPELFQKRINTLYKGYLPIVESEENRGGIRYGIQAFATTLTGKPEDKLIMFVRVWTKNESKDRKTASFWAGSAYDPYIHFSADRKYLMKKGMSLETKNCRICR